MKQNLLEDVPLVRKMVVLNPGELKKFDEIVGTQNRSSTLRELIREYIEEQLKLEEK